MQSGTNSMKHRTRAGICRRGVAAFSLLEVVIALTILAMITTSLFAIIKGSVKGASDIERVQRENDQLNRFLELCRLTFQTMPSSATLTLKSIDANNAASGQELSIAGVPTCFGFGLTPTSYEETVIGLRPDTIHPTAEDGSPRFDLAITRKDIIPQTSDNQMSIQQSVSGALATDEQGRSWLPLLPGVVLLQWQFFKDSTDEWLPEWSSSKWPDLIELKIQMEGRSQPMRIVWATPETQLRAPTRTAPAPAKTTTTTTTTPNKGGTTGAK